MTLLSTDYKLLDSGKKWTTTTIMAGVHGNEKSGIIILQELANTLQIV
jgi:predicted deacylase